MIAEARFRPAWAEVDLGAVRHNVDLLRRHVAPSELWAVVKADGYGHGAVAVAHAAREAGASGFAVALVDEGIALREAGIGGTLLVLSEAPRDAVEPAVAAGLALCVAGRPALEQAAAVARRLGVRASVHVKVDTGMHRIGVDPGGATALISAVAAEPSLRLEGVWTHLAVADGGSEEDRAFTALQLERFDKVVAGLGERPAVVHAANTAGAVAWPEARYDAVRCGIGVYGISPSPSTAVLALRPALSLRARVVAVRELPAGSRPSYGRLRPLPEAGVVATVPLGYADGVPRGLFAAGAEVLVGGRRRPLAGMVTMDQLMVDCGPGSSVGVGDEVTLLGAQGAEEITAWEWASALGTIPYEVVCGIGARVPRVPVDPGR